MWPRLFEERIEKEALEVNEEGNARPSGATDGT